MKYAILTILLAFCLVPRAKAQYYYWIDFTDKNNTAFSLSNPEDYLSERAIERRIKQDIAIDSLDLPVNQSYIDSVLTLDIRFVHSSKWLNGITIESPNDSLMNSLQLWSFVKEVKQTKVPFKSARNKFEEFEVMDAEPIDSSKYGGSVHQVAMLEGQYLHNMGYEGKGLQIAVLDAGFYKADEYPAFDSLWHNEQILGTRDFVNPNSNIFETHWHGMSVLSCMGGNIPGELIGTAPKASYWLLRSEDAGSEFIIEEDNWIAAAEFADSVGVDIINSSLGYTMFDDASSNHTYEDLDGKTTRITRGANIAASRGILVFSSAGNERNDPWFRLVAPSDGDGVIGVGAVDKELVPAYFTSAGPAADGDIKPNVAALGYRTTLQLSGGNVGLASGTSFSSPVLAGMCASLWQRYPDKTAKDVKEVIEKSAHMYNSPDSLLGYGIPNMRIASGMLDPLSVDEKSGGNKWLVYPNPFQDQIFLRYRGNYIADEVTIELYSLSGQLIHRWIKPLSETVVLNNVPVKSEGIYLLKTRNGTFSETVKLSKAR